MTQTIGWIYDSRIYLTIDSDKKFRLYFYLLDKLNVEHFTKEIIGGHYPGLSILQYTSKPLTKQQVLDVCEYLKYNYSAKIIDDLDEFLDKFLLETLL